MRSEVGKSLRGVALAWMLCLGVQACQTTPTVRAIPFDASLAEDCVARPVPLDTWGDVAVAYATRDQDLKVCNADKAALRAWLAAIE